jgi:hypothetical protein
MVTIFDAAVQMRLSGAALARVEPLTAPRLAVQALLDSGLAADALGLLARLLPRRYAVAWACQCGRRQTLSEHDRAGLMLAEAWLIEPGEAQRAAAFAFASTHRYKTIGAWIAAAAGWADGNLNPAYDGPTPPPPHLTAIAASAAVSYMAALQPAQFNTRRIAFVCDALDLLGDADAEADVMDGGRQ